MRWFLLALSVVRCGGVGGGEEGKSFLEVFESEHMLLVVVFKINKAWSDRQGGYIVLFVVPRRQASV